MSPDEFTGEPVACDEGELEWVDKQEVLKLNIWEGDKIFFRLLEEQQEFFSLKLVYDGTDRLVEAALNGRPLELFDIRDENGQPTGIVRERGVAHRDGSRHGTVHIWIVRENEKSGFDLLLQKRSANKDSHPGCYDISSAGHVAAGDDYLPSAVRELSEELGVLAEPEELEFLGFHEEYRENIFYGKPFRNREISAVYVYRKSVKAEELSLQREEVESVCWMDFLECLEAVKAGTIPTCLHEEELRQLGQYLEIDLDQG